MWCLGDLVGYGAEPDACVALAREHCTICLAGNHDLAVTGDALARGVLARRRARGAVDAGGHRRRDARVPARALARGRGGRRRALPRLPARPGLGVRALAADRRAVPRRDRLPRLASSATRTSRCPSTAARASRRPARPAARATSSTSRRASGCSTPAARPAARRRPARRLAAARHRRPGPRSGAASSTTSRAPQAAIRAARLPGLARRAARVRSVTAGGSCDRLPALRCVARPPRARARRCSAPAAGEDEAG